MGLVAGGGRAAASRRRLAPRDRRAVPQGPTGIFDSVWTPLACVLFCSSVTAALGYHAIQSKLAWGTSTTGAWYAAAAFPWFQVLAVGGAGLAVAAGPGARRGAHRLVCGGRAGHALAGDAPHLLGRGGRSGGPGADRAAPAAVPGHRHLPGGPGRCRIAAHRGCGVHGPPSNSRARSPGGPTGTRSTSGLDAEIGSSGRLGLAGTELTGPALRRPGSGWSRGTR